MEAAMDANGLVVMPGKGPVWKMAPGRSSTLKLQNGETDESVMIFEEVAPVGTVTPMHLHHDSDEVAYVLSGEITFKIGDAVEGLPCGPQHRRQWIILLQRR